MKTLFIHIGTPKTATTSLQHFCEENESILEEQGYCYPVFPHKFKHISILRNGFFLSYKKSDEQGNRKELEEEAFFRQGMDFSKNHKWILDDTEMQKDIVTLIGNISVQLRQENRELKSKLAEMEKNWTEYKKKVEQLQRAMNRSLYARILGKIKK